MKKSIYLLGLPLAALALAGCSALINTSSDNPNPGGGGSDPSSSLPGTADQGATEKFQAITYGILSGSDYIVGQNNAVQARFARLSKAQPVSSEVLKTQIEKINPYMLTAESLLTGELNPSAMVTVNYEEGAELPYSMAVEGGTFHWREEALPNHDVDEEEYKIIGKYVIDGVTYEVEGKREAENSHNENELETELWIKMSQNEFVMISYETETEVDEMETGFTYGTYSRMWDDDTASFEVEVNYEKETERRQEVAESSIEVTTPGEEAEFKLLNKAGNDINLEYEFEDDRNRTEHEGNLIATVSEDGSTYTYKSGTQTIVTLPRA